MKPLLSNPQFTTYISNIPQFTHKNRPFLNPQFQFPKPLPTHNPTTLCSCSADNGGWADLITVDNSTQSNQLTRLLNSFGINEKKYAFVYLFGFVCALGVSRVRVSSIVVIPACFLVFAVGFSFGIVNRWDFDLSLFGSNGGKKNKKKQRVKDEEFRVSSEKLKTLGDFLNGFDVKFVNLKRNMRKDVDLNRISKSDLVGYIESVESIEQGVSQATSMIDSMVVDANDVSKPSNYKPIDQKKKANFDIPQFFAGFRERSFGSNPSKVKDGVKNEAKVMDPIVENKKMKSVASDDDGRTRNDGDVRVKETYGGKTIGRMGRMALMEMETDAKQVFDKDDFFIKDKRMRFVKNRNLVETWESDDGFLDLDSGAGFKQKRTKEYYEQEQWSYNRYNGNNNMLYDDLESNEKEGYGYENENRFATSPSSEISSDMLFSDYVTEANALLKQAREWLRHRGIEEDAEKMLYKSTELLSKAVEMKPMSLVAVGQLGNTYLLHGELKLKLSRKLRALLAESDASALDDEVSNREKFVDYLVNVCEECEELLVKAGRKYRMALSIDADDMRALYNWGLALSFRAQLIADIGPEAAFDADKVYLAAIDKFDAMMSRSNAHTPDALFRWGVALQQRSRLRTRNYREKVKLLSQAKRLYEDALLMDSDNLQVKQALMTIESELRYKNRY